MSSTLLFAQGAQTWIEEAQGYVVYRLRIDPTQPLGAVVDFVSPTMETLHGARDRSDFTTWFESVHPDDLPRVMQAHFHAESTGTVFDQTYRVNVDGQVRWMKTVSRPATDETGTITHYNGFMVDLTEQMRAREEAERARQALAELQHTASASLLAAGVAHDLNNVLQVVQMACTLALEDPDGDVDELLAEIQGAVEQGSHLSRRLTTRLLDDGDTVRPTDVGASVAEACRLFARSQPGLTIVPPEPLGHDAYTAPVVLDHVLLNLLINASHATNGHGTITVTVARHDDDVCIDVVDDGPGVAPAHRDRIFTPRFSTKGTTGLGLASSVQALQSIGGTLQLLDSDGGAHFRVRLADALLAPRAPLPDDEGTSQALAVAVIAEEPARSLLSRMLRLLPHRQVDPEQADVVLVDEASHRIPTGRPAVVLAAQPASPRRAHTEVLLKPFRIDHLEQALQRVRASVRAAPGVTGE
jgi:PAS domain S-box-containing protein